MRHQIIILAAILPLAACGRGDGAPPPDQQQHMSLDEVASRPPIVPLESSDTSAATWTVDETGQAIDFGNEGEAALLTLACRLREDPPQLAIIRHAPARPGQSALLPVIGNGMRSRFLVDALLAEGEWRWEGSLPADDPQLDVFTGTRRMTATLPGGGMLEIAGSRIPGEFVSWCRAGRQMLQTQAEEVEEAGES